MNSGGVTNQVANELKGLGQEASKQLGQAGEEIVKGTVKELLGSDQGEPVEQEKREGVSQQAPVMNEVEELKQRKEAEKQRGLKRVRGELESYRQWQNRLKEELSSDEERQEQQQAVVEKKKKRNFWKGFLGRTRSQHGGTGEMVKTKH